MDKIAVTINGKPAQVAAGATVAAALMMCGEPSRHSVNGEVRHPFCGMGICMECRATINGQSHQRSCQLICTPGMEIQTD